MNTSSIKTFLKDPVARFSMLSSRGFYNWMSDENYLKKAFKLKMGYDLNLDNPQTFNEKLQWLKIHDRKPIYTTMVDKYEAKKYVANIIGEEYIIPTYGVWDKFDDIDFDSLPDQFVLKCTHDSGGLVIVRNKAQMDIKSARKKINKALRKNYYWNGREWPYKNVKPRIIAEQYMEDSDHKTDPELIDYKFYCFNGEPKYLYVSQGLENHATARISFLTLDWEFAPFGRSDYSHFEKLPEKPKHFSEMVDFAKKFSEGHDFLRVDFYEVDQQDYFGEFTFTPVSGMMPFVPEEWDLKMGELLKLTGGGYVTKYDDAVLYCQTFDKGGDLADYKIWCFNGAPQYIQYITGRYNGKTEEAFYNTSWEKQSFFRHNRLSEEVTEKPKCLNELLSLSRELAKGTYFVRIDFYVPEDNNIKFGEITFYPMSGMERFQPDKVDYELGKLIKLPVDNINGRE